MVDVDDCDEEKYDVGLIPYSVKPQQGHSLWRNSFFKDLGYSFPSDNVGRQVDHRIDRYIRITDLSFLSSTLLDNRHSSLGSIYRVID